MLRYPWYCYPPFRWIYYREKVRKGTSAYTSHFVFGWLVWIDQSTGRKLMSTSDIEQRNTDESGAITMWFSLVQGSMPFSITIHHAPNAARMIWDKMVASGFHPTTTRP